MEKTAESVRDISNAVEAAMNADAAASRALEFSENATALIKRCATTSVTLGMIGLAKEAARILVYRLNEAEEAVKKAEPHLRPNTKLIGLSDATTCYD